MKPVIAIVPSAGLSRRFGGEKIFVNLRGRPIFVHTLEALQVVDEIEEIIPVMRSEEMVKGVKIIEQYGIEKVKKIAPGGGERQESVFSGMKLIKKEHCIVVIHDGVRPLVKPEIVKEAIYALEGYDGVVVGVSVKDTIKEIGKDVIKRTLKRDQLVAVQTPQVFYYDVLMKAYSAAIKAGMHFTDDSAIVEYYGGRVKVVRGSYRNIKITTPEDLSIAEIYLYGSET